MSCRTSIALFGQQNAKDTISSLFERQRQIDTRSFETEDESGTEPVVATFVTHGLPQSEDVLLVVCNRSDSSSIRYVTDRVWDALDNTPHWQPVLLAVIGDKHSSKGSEGLLSELQHRMDQLTRFYGVLDLPRNGGAVLNACVDAVKSPIHVIWDRRSRALTADGDRALRRTFWLLDRDVDGYLSDAEVLLWHNKMYAESSEEDIEVAKEHLKKTQIDDEPTELFVEGKGVTPDGFVTILRTMLLEGQGSPVWSLLWDSGLYQDALPYCSQDLDAACYDPSCEVLQLSGNGCQFFGGLYSLRRFVNPNDMWTFTPDCPWIEWAGMPLSGASIAQDDFVRCWKVVAIRDPAAVVAFAAYWGYKGDPNLLFVRKKPRATRTREADWPSTFFVAVLGSPQCGKSALIRKLCRSAHSTGGFVDDELSGDDCSVVPFKPGLSSVGATNVSLHGREVTIVYEEIGDREVDSAFENSAFVARLDCILMCFDGNDPYSFGYVASMFPTIQQRAGDIPAVLCMSKADLPIEDQRCHEEPSKFCQRFKLAWPPVITSCSVNAQQFGLANDVDVLSVMLADTVLHPELSKVEPVSTGRQIRRATIIIGGASLVIWAISRWLKKRR